VGVNSPPVAPLYAAGLRVVSSLIYGRKKLDFPVVGKNLSILYVFTGEEPSGSRKKVENPVVGKNITFGSRKKIVIFTVVGKNFIYLTAVVGKNHIPVG
jgi:hypothetical protein